MPKGIKYMRYRFPPSTILFFITCIVEGGIAHAVFIISAWRRESGQGVRVELIRGARKQPGPVRHTVKESWKLSTSLCLSSFGGQPGTQGRGLVTKRPDPAQAGSCVRPGTGPASAPGPGPGPQPQPGPLVSLFTVAPAVLKGAKCF